jgi:imidazolonepropionase-like amidohydrolase
LIEDKVEMDTVLIGGNLIDGTGREPVPGAGVVVKEGKVHAVGPVGRLSYGRDARVIDVAGLTIMPGLIDTHTHLTYHGDQPNVWQLEFEESVELNTLKAARNAAHILQTGFTSIGDGGCRGYIGPAIRDGVVKGVIPGPHIVAAGPILTGSAGLLDGMPAWIRVESDQALGMTVNGVDEVRRAVRVQVKGGVDWIKVSASGVAGSRFATAETEDLSADEIVAAVSEARKYGKPVHAHAHSREGVRAAVEAGVLSLHSGEFVDEEILILMREKGIIFSPTVAWLHARCLPGYVLAQNPVFVEEAWRAYAAAKISIVKARALGVKMAMGSDASHRFHHVPDGALELEYYQELGWPALEVIKAATKTAAEAINRGDSLGTLAPGKVADILVVEGPVAEDVRELRDKRNIKWMFEGGRELVLAPDRCIFGAEFKVAEWLDEPLGRSEPHSRAAVRS